MLLLVRSAQLVPIIMYEYKPIVNPDEMRVDANGGMEMFLQANCCMRYHKRRILLHCLADLKMCFYFKITNSQRLSTEW